MPLDVYIKLDVAKATTLFNKKISWATQASPCFFLREFQPIISAPNDNSLSSD